MTRRPIRIDDLYALRMATDPALAPDGGRVVWSERYVSDDRRHNLAALWAADVRDPARSAGELATPRRLTDGVYADRTPRISPDGARIAFVRENPGEDDAPSALCTIAADGSGLRVLASERGAFGAPCWSPDGRSLAVAFRRADALPEGERAPIAIRVTSLHYKEDGQGYLPADKFHIYRISTSAPNETSAPALAQLTRGEWDDVEPTWSPDGSRIAFLSSRRADDPENIDLFTMPAAGGEPVQCTRERGWMSHACWAPDGTWLAAPACPAGPAQALTRAQMRLYRVFADGSRTEECLTPDLDRSVLNLTIDDVWGLTMDMAPVFTRDGGRIVFPIADRGITRLAALPLADGRPAGAIEPVVDDASVIAFSGSGGRIVFVSTTATEPGRIEVCDDDGGDRAVVAWPLAGLMSELAIRSPIEFTVRHTDTSGAAQVVSGDAADAAGVDDVDIHGWLALPEGDGPHPLLLYIHGGPVVQFGRGYFHMIQSFAAAGFAVLFVNPRGSQGYGIEFASAIYRDWGTRPFADLMAAVDWALANHPIDEARMGVLGGSYGGYMTNWVIAHTNRFRAACTMRTVSAMDAMLWCDWGYMFSHEIGATPWEDPEVYRRMSPLTYADKIETPLLIIHGLSDCRTPPDQGERLYVTLRMMGKPCEMVLFPGAGHNMSRTGRPVQRAEHMRVLHEWFERHLLR